jgi:tetratricopeptide (TPR) repeat protein
VFAVLYSWAAEPEPDSAGRRRLAELSREAAALDVPEDLLPEAPKPWPDSLPGKFLIARFHGSLGAALSKKQAEVEFTEILAYVPEFAPAWYLRGRTRLELDQAEGALADFRQAARLDPRLPEAHRWAAVALDRLGRRAEAGKEAERALAGEPDYAEARELRERLKP